jgi:plastocyanin
MNNELSGRRPLWLLPIFISFLAGCDNTPRQIVHRKLSVLIENMQFQPAELTVKKGDTVVFLNKDLVAHDVTDEVEKAWSSQRMEPGSSWSMTVDQSESYFCSIHVVMKGHLTMQ